MYCWQSCSKDSTSIISTHGPEAKFSHHNHNKATTWSQVAPSTGEVCLKLCSNSKGSLLRLQTRVDLPTIHRVIQMRIHSLFRPSLLRRTTSQLFDSLCISSFHCKNVSPCSFWDFWCLSASSKSLLHCSFTDSVQLPLPSWSYSFLFHKFSVTLCTLFLVPIS